MNYHPRPERASRLEYIVATITLPVVILVILGFLGPALGNVFSNVTTTPSGTPITPTPTNTPQMNFVVTKLADTNDGVCDSDCSLREAIAVTRAGGTITFASGLTGSIVLGNQISITKSVT